jgi:hypothetical protein
VFGEAPVASWEPASQRRYPVDSGTGCFVDAASAQCWAADERARSNANAQAVRARGIDPNDTLAWHEAWRELARGQLDLLELLGVAGYNRPRRGVAIAIPGAGGNLVAFKSGAGDGSYASHWALDPTGAAVALVTDFGLLRNDHEPAP